MKEVKAKAIWNNIKVNTGTARGLRYRWDCSRRYGCQERLHLPESFVHEDKKPEMDSIDDFEKHCEDFWAVVYGFIRLFGESYSGIMSKGWLKWYKFRVGLRRYKNSAWNGWLFKLRQRHIGALCGLFVISGDCFIHSGCEKESVNSSIYPGII